MMPNFANSAFITPVLHDKGKNSDPIGAVEQVVDEPPKLYLILIFYLDCQD